MSYSDLLAHRLGSESSVFARTACNVDLEPTRTTYWTRRVMRRVLIVTHHRGANA